MRQWIGSASFQIMACRLFGTKPLSKPMLGFVNSTFRNNFSEILIVIHIFSFKKMHLKTSSMKWQPFWPGGDELTQITTSTQKTVGCIYSYIPQLPRRFRQNGVDVWHGWETAHHRKQWMLLLMHGVIETTVTDKLMRHQGQWPYLDLDHFKWKFSSSITMMS